MRERVIVWACVYVCVCLCVRSITTCVILVHTAAVHEQSVKESGCSQRSDNVAILVCVNACKVFTSGSHQSWRRWRWIWWGSLGAASATSQVAGHTCTSHITRHTSHITRHTSHVTRHTCYCISECSFIALRYVHDTTEAKHLHPTSFKAQNLYQNMRMQALGASPLALPSARSP